ncbi:hypothetical protein BDQ17DRAFT_1543412 [Cyathus striatus]|nr:hypothetical protein BDQ17DRAFT_1543412 [Cyathus striatus]
MFPLLKSSSIINMISLSPCQRRPPLPSSALSTTLYSARLVYVRFVTPGCVSAPVQSQEGVGLRRGGGGRGTPMLILRPTPVSVSGEALRIRGQGDVFPSPSTRVERWKWWTG